MSRFTDIERESVRKRVLAVAQADTRISGGALVGSFASNKEDKWSDLDMTFGVKTGNEPKQVLNEWTKLLDSEFGIIHFFDVPRGNAIYRVILFPNCLELDLSVVPESEYGALAPGFSLLFGKAIERKDFPKQSVVDLIGWGWHHVLHANSAINRDRPWQAEFWLSALRDHIIALKCIHFDLPSAHGRGVDKLPKEETKELEPTLIKSAELSEMRRVLNILSEILIKEVQYHDKKLAEELRGIFKEAICPKQ